MRPAPVQKQTAEIYDDIEQVTAMNPNLTIDELNAVVQRKAQEMNSRPNEDFCGLSANHMQNWLYAPFKQKEWVSISTPSDISSSPVMRYLEVILDEAMSQGGSFKATAKGNLPVKVVKKAQALLPKFAVSKFTFHYRLNEFTGINEDKFNALHYTRILAELAGIIYHRSGKIHVKKAAQKEYQTHGLKAFFLPMLEASINDYNWAYLDGFDDVDVTTHRPSGDASYFVSRGSIVSRLTQPP